MKKRLLSLVSLTGLLVTLSACFGPTTPQEVSRTFWEAVITDSAKDAVKYSTLTEIKYYDHFSMDWEGFQPSFGKVIIDKQDASIVTEMASPANSGLEPRHFTTYLVLREGKWNVDYDRTNTAIHGGPLGELFNKLHQMGNELSRQLDTSAERFKQEMERLGKELEQMSESFGQQATESLDKYAEQLRQSLKALEESINRALEEEDNKLKDDDKQALREIAVELDKEREHLTDPTPQAVSEGSQHFGETQQQLDAIDNAALDDYKKEWQAVRQQFEDTLHRMMDELSSPGGKGNDQKQ